MFVADRNTVDICFSDSGIRYKWVQSYCITRHQDIYSKVHAYFCS